MIPYDDVVIKAEKLAVSKFLRLHPAFRFMQEDVRAEGSRGALLATRSFNPDKGRPISAWVFRKTYYHILDWARTSEGSFHGFSHMGRISRKQGINLYVESLHKTNRSTGELIHNPASPAATPEYCVDVQDDVNNLLQHITHRERTIIMMRMMELTMKAIAKSIGVSESRIAQIISVVMRKLNAVNNE